MQLRISPWKTRVLACVLAALGAVSANADHSLQIQPIPEQRVFEGQVLSFEVDATGPASGAPLTYAIQGAPGITIDPNGIATWTPGTGTTGVYQVQVKVTDHCGGLSHTDEEVVTVIVEDSNQAP